VVKPDGPIVLIDTMIASGAALRRTGGRTCRLVPQEVSARAGSVTLKRVHEIWNGSGDFG